ncbi:MAG: tRNA-specific adenosine deaminase [Acidiferrobacteraceae bacterium]|jgi:guanine deaminase|nr:tRNA-specific adenosine deaminase [Acidiferrobacteraceae bacterium]|tara:strand:+ start:48648 stop:49124 length:477 start_codon:yes stop_codon:yes gene_type:complete
MGPKHSHFVEIAAKISLDKMLDGEGGPFGAIIVRDDQIIGQGWNQVTSKLDPTAHAEISAIRNACKNINSFTLENSVIYSSCEPCPMCLSAIWWARITEIYYANTRDDAAQAGFDDAEIYHEICRDLTDRYIPMNHCKNDLATTALETWMNKIDKIPY